MASLKDMCDYVDDFVADGTSRKIDGSIEFWRMLNKDASSAQMYAECLIYKYISLCYGLANKPLFQNLSQIKNISAPANQQLKTETASSPSGSSSPRGSLSSTSKPKRGSGSFDPQAADTKSTPKKKFNIKRRKSEDSKKAKKELSLDGSDSRRKSKKRQSSEIQENQGGYESRQEQTNLDNVLLSLTYVARMDDLTRWDFTKLREVFLTWTKARGWEQTGSDYEYAVMKRFSMAPPANIYDEEQVKKYISEIISSTNKEPDEISVSDGKQVGESIKYWEMRHKILTRPEEATTVIKCLTAMAKKIYDDGEEAKVLPLLHILSETIIMSPHTPLELLQQCYSAFELFYLWPSYVAHPVKEVLDMIQLEMKCPGHFYRMIFFQDNDMSLASHLSAKMPSSETHVFIDEEIPESDAIREAFKKLGETRASTSQLTAKGGMHRFTLKHIFESVFGSGCCDLSTLEEALQSIPDDLIEGMCFEALSLMEEASMKHSHTEAQDFLRSELEKFSDRLVEFLEVENEDQLSDELVTEVDRLKEKSTSFRRVSVLYENYRIRDPGSPVRSSFSSGQVATPSPRRNNSYLRRNTSGTLDNPLGARKLASKADALTKGTPAELLGSKVLTTTFHHADLTESIFELVRNTAKEYVQEKKRDAKLGYIKKDLDVTYRDSGVVDDEEPNGDVKPITSEVQHSSIDEKEEEVMKEGNVKMRDKTLKEQISSSSNEEDSASKLEGDSFLKDFMEKGFDSDSEEIAELLKNMTFDQRKSFVLGNKKKRQSNSSEPLKPYVVNISLTPPMSPTIVVQNPTSDKNEFSRAKEGEAKVESKMDFPEGQDSMGEVVHLRPHRTDNKKPNRLSRFVRSKTKSTKKDKSDGDVDKLSSRESLSSVSSTPSSTTSEELSDTQSARIRTTSDPVFRRKRGKWGTAPTSSPLVGRNKRNRLSVDVMPRSPFNLSVRSLPSTERGSLLGADVFNDSHPVSSHALINMGTSCEDEKLSKDNSLETGISTDYPVKTSPILPSKAKFILGIDDDDDESRQRIDSGIGTSTRRRTTSSHNNTKEEEDHGIGGVKFAVKEVIRASRRRRMSIGDSLSQERTVYKKVLKLVFVGNDKTVGHIARAYYNLRKKQLSRAPLFQHIDLRIYFIPLSTTSSRKEVEDVVFGQELMPCDIRVGELLGTYDSWFHTAVTLSVNNLVRVYPKISPREEVENNSPDKMTEKSTANKLLAPQEVIASALLSYCRFAVSRTDVSMYKVAMQSSTGEVYTDVFCCQLKIGHDAYTTAVKAGRFGKLGKLVDLTNDSGPPPAYTKIEYSKWSIDGRLIRTCQLDESFYHTVCLSPLSLSQNNFKGTDVLQLVLIDNEKRQKVSKRASNTRLTALEEAELAGSILDIGTMKMEVVRPTQGTFCLVLDNSVIYTRIKSIEIVPCATPEADYAHIPGKSAPRHLREHQLIRLPLRTFWTGTQ